ncbi:MAG TPA: hypothetical protein VFS00_10635 [Polyangiaceae bacterium]|nr:hypothetical protein [Polyangiaceae bacterium]
MSHPSEREEDERDEAWLLARARGEAAEHPDPERAAAYLRLEKAIAGLELPKAPPGWQAGVLAAIDRDGAETFERPPSIDPTAIPPPGRAGRPTRRWRNAVWPVAAALAVAAVVAFFFLRPPPKPQDELLAYNFERAKVRSDSKPDEAAVGDTLVAVARPEGAGELRVYRDRRELVLRCPGGASCSVAREGNRSVVRGTQVLKGPGEYRIVALSGARVPEPSGRGEDADLQAAQAAGATFDTQIFRVK